MTFELDLIIADLGCISSMGIDLDYEEMCI